MKEFYEKPQADVEEFISVDILTVSGNDPDTDIPWGQ